MNVHELRSAMAACEQRPGHSTLDHGESVHTWARGIIADLSEWHVCDGVRWPKWAEEYGDAIVANLHPPEVIARYAVFHDGGKFLCRTVDSDGTVHFPDHAAVSERVYREVFPEDATVAKLIRHDMEIHTLSAAEIETRLAGAWSMQDACTLLVVALAEVHANAVLFGGIESVGFKMKWKTIDRRGNMVCRKLFGVPSRV